MEETGNWLQLAVRKRPNGAGYAEADPNLDVGWLDAAHKLAIRCRLIAFAAPRWIFEDRIEGSSAVSIATLLAAATWARS